MLQSDTGHRKWRAILRLSSRRFLEWSRQNTLINNSTFFFFFCPWWVIDSLILWMCATQLSWVAQFKGENVLSRLVFVCRTTSKSRRTFFSSKGTYCFCIFFFFFGTLWSWKVMWFSFSIGYSSFWLCRVSILLKGEFSFQAVFHNVAQRLDKSFHQC